MGNQSPTYTFPKKRKCIREKFVHPIIKGLEKLEINGRRQYIIQKQENTIILEHLKLNKRQHRLGINDQLNLYTANLHFLLLNKL